MGDEGERPTASQRPWTIGRGSPLWQSLMPNSPSATVFSAIARAGLVRRGAFHLADDERAGPLADLRTIVLIGVTGRSGWDAFAASAEARDGAEHPLDRWSRRVIDALARDLGAVSLYPFGGPPHFPFQQWARRAEPVHPSPVGMLIHPVYGLWHSYRGALGFAQALDVPPFEARPSPCEACRGRPCLERMPGRRLLRRRLRRSRLRGAPQERRRRRLHGLAAACARRACPVGAAHVPKPEQAAFAMQAFRGSRRREGEPSSQAERFGLSAVRAVGKPVKGGPG